jgi:hypothetical protein
MKIWLHTRKPPGVDGNWVNTDEEFPLVPRVGDYIAKADGNSPFWYLVDLVILIPKSAKSTFNSYDAEVFAVEVDHLDAHARAHREADARVASSSLHEE